MIRYEVNITVNNAILDAFLVWLVPHMKDMLKFDGFQSGQYFKALREDSKDTTTIVVCYQVTALDKLDEYFDNHSQMMRSEVFNHFNEHNLSFSRRIFEAKEEVLKFI